MTNVEQSAGRRVLNVNSDYQTLLPEPTDAELNLLRESIIADGVRDPIIAWNGTIVDGHHRYAIANELGYDYRVIDRDFESDLMVRQWIITTQIGRRNLEPGQIAVASLELVRIEKILAAERRGTRNDLTDTPIKTACAATTVAKLVGIGSRTMERVMAVDDLAPELIPVIASGQLAPKRAEQIIRTPDPELRAELIAAELSDDGALAHKLNTEKRRADAAQQKSDDETRLAVAADRAATLAKHPEFKPTPEFVVPKMEPSPAYAALTEKITTANVRYIEQLIVVSGITSTPEKSAALIVLDAVIADMIRMRADVAKTDFMARLEPHN